MKVYVLETGCYESRSIHGVYASAEAAMAAWQPKPPEREPQFVTRYDATTGRTEWVTVTHQHTYTWAADKHDPGCWSFDGDFDDAAEADITEYEVQP